MNTMDSQQVVSMYDLIREKPQLQGLRTTLYYSRKFGFPFACTHSPDVSIEKQLLWVTRLFFEVADASLCDVEIPDELHLDQNSALYTDAMMFIENSATLPMLNKHYPQQTHDDKKDEFMQKHGFLAIMNLSLICLIMVTSFNMLSEYFTVTISLVVIFLFPFSIAVLYKWYMQN